MDGAPKTTLLNDNIKIIRVLFKATDRRHRPPSLEPRPALTGSQQHNYLFPVCSCVLIIQPSTIKACYKRPSVCACVVAVFPLSSGVSQVSPSLPLPLLARSDWLPPFQAAGPYLSAGRLHLRVRSHREGVVGFFQSALSPAPLVCAHPVYEFSGAELHTRFRFRRDVS